MQIARGAGVKNPLRQLGGSLRVFRLQLPDHNIQLRRSGCKRLEAAGPVFPQSPVKIQSSGPAVREASGKLASRHKRQKLLRGPQSHGCGSGPRTLQTDFAQVYGAPGERFLLAGVKMQLR